VTRAAICGGTALREACAALGLEPSDEPRLVIVDLREPGAAAAAATFASELPRVVIATAEQAAVLDAIGARALVARSADPEAIGPLVARAIPRPARDRTRVVTFTAARGGSGRTLCAANLACRLSRDSTVLAIDATGTGGLGWWLGVEPRPWSELEALAAELRADHLEVVATPIGPRLSLVGGPPTAPTPDVLAAVVAAARDLADLVLVDAPLLADERTRRVVVRSDRVLVHSYADAASCAALATADLPADAWVLGSQGQLDGAFRTLPRDEAAIADALVGRGAVRGALGHAYDDVAELLAIDAS
jgi:hypothetical protein